MNNNSKKETMKKVIFSAAILNVLAASNVAVASTESRVKQQITSYEVLGSANAHDPHWFDNNGCKYNNACKVD